MLAVNAASMKFFRVVSCFSLFKKNPSVTSFTEGLPRAPLFKSIIIFHELHKFSQGYILKKLPYLDVFSLVCRGRDC